MPGSVLLLKKQRTRTHRHPWQQRQRQQQWQRRWPRWTLRDLRQHRRRRTKRRRPEQPQRRRRASLLSSSRYGYDWEAKRRFGCEKVRMVNSNNHGDGVSQKKTGTTAEFHTMMGDDGRIPIARHMMMVAVILCGQCVAFVPSLGGYLRRHCVVS